MRGFNGGFNSTWIRQPAHVHADKPKASTLPKGLIGSLRHTLEAVELLSCLTTYSAAPITSACEKLVVPREANAVLLYICIQLARIYRVRKVSIVSP